MPLPLRFLVVPFFVAGCSAGVPTLIAASSPAPAGSVAKLDLPGQSPAVHNFSYTPKQVAKGGSMTFTIKATSPIGKPLTYTWFANKGQLSATTGTSTVTWTPTKADGTPDVGAATVAVTVSDGGGANTATALVQVAVDGSATGDGGTAPAYSTVQPGATTAAATAE